MKLITMTAAALLAIGAGGAGTAVGSSAPRVGHTVERIVVEGSNPLPDQRQVDVHLWYPADRKGFSRSDLSSYTSRLHGVALTAPFASLSWRVDAEVAREDAPIDPRGGRYPVIVFSHGSVNEPIDYAHTLELIAGAGFVVAAPTHVNNTQDDVRLDFVGLPCNDGLPAPCSRANVPVSIADRVRDVSAVLTALPGWLGHRVDVERAGVMGHSRGTVSALAAAGGGANRTFPAESRVKALMGMAIGVQAVTDVADLASVEVPALLVAGGLDVTSPPAVSEYAYDRIRSRSKAYVEIPQAVHRSFDSTYCAQAHAAGAIAQANADAILDLHTARGILVHQSSGVATQYCAPATFSGIETLVEAVTGAPVPPNVPTTGLETDEVKRGMRTLAVAYFRAALKGNARGFMSRLTPKWLERRLPMVGRVRVSPG